MLKDADVGAKRCVFSATCIPRVAETIRIEFCVVSERDHHCRATNGGELGQRSSCAVMRATERCIGTLSVAARGARPARDVQDAEKALGKPLDTWELCNPETGTLWAL